MKKALIYFSIATLLLLCLSSRGFAVTFGAIEINSRLNEPLDVTIEVTDYRNKHLPVIVDVASRLEHRYFHIPFHHYQLDLKLDFYKNSKDQAFIKITSSLPVESPEIRFLMLFLPAHGKVFRDVKIPMEGGKDLMTYQIQKKKEQLLNKKMQALANHLPSMQVMHVPIPYSEKSLNKSSSKPRGRIASTLKLKWENGTARLFSEKSQTNNKTEKQKNSSRLANNNETQKTKTVMKRGKLTSQNNADDKIMAETHVKQKINNQELSPAKSSDSDQWKYIVIKGDSLWKIARRIKKEKNRSESIPIIVEMLFESNSKAFDNHNPSKLKIGALLSMSHSAHNSEKKPPVPTGKYEEQKKPSSGKIAVKEKKKKQEGKNSSQAITDKKLKSISEIRTETRLALKNPDHKPLPLKMLQHREGYIVKNGETLWRIAYRLHQTTKQGVSQAELMALIHKNNPKAFINGNSAKILSGALIHLPEVTASSD